MGTSLGDLAAKGRQFAGPCRSQRGRSGAPTWRNPRKLRDKSGFSLGDRKSFNINRFGVAEGKEPGSNLLYPVNR